MLRFRQSLIECAVRAYMLTFSDGSPPDDSTAAAWPPPRERSQAQEMRRQLAAMAHGRAGPFPEDRLVDHVLALHRSVSVADGWRILEPAMREILRRVRAAEGEELTVAVRPGQRCRIGSYRTRQKGRGLRPWRTVLRALDPFGGSCDCPDFTRSSLGLCKHLVAVYGDATKRRRFASPEASAEQDQLVWDPVRPLDGEGDWLERVQLVPGRRAAPSLRRVFRATAAGELRIDPRVSRSKVLGHLRESIARRPELVALEPALAALLRADLREDREATVRSVDRRRDRRAFASLERPLFEHQRAGVERFLELERLLIADEMGLGKTAQAIAACHVAHRTGRVRRGLVVVPTSLKDQWEQEWNRFSDAPLHRAEGRADQRAERIEGLEGGFLLIGYAQLRSDVEVLREWAPEMVVLDEAQRIKNELTLTARCLRKLAPRYRLALTGTPLENRLGELASIVDWIDDRALEPRWRLNPWHALAGERAETVGVRELRTLRERIAHCVLRRRYADIRSALPERTDRATTVTMTPAQQAEHDDLDSPIARLIRMGRKRPLTRPEFLKLMALMTRQRIIANGLAQLRFESVWPSIEHRHPTSALEELDAPKLRAFRDVVRDLVVDRAKKVVVFSQWQRAIRLSRWAVGDMLEQNQLSAAFFTGAEGARARRDALVRFHDDPSTRLLFCTDAGGVGLNLQHAASHVINLELPWNPAVREQRIARVHRLGQDRPVEVIDLVAERSIEERIATSLAAKRQLFCGLFDSEEDEIHFEQTSLFLDGFAPEADPEPRPDAKPPAPIPAEGAPTREPMPAPEPAPRSLDDERHGMLGSFRVDRTHDGRVVHEAAALTLALVFRRVAALLEGG